MHLHAALFDMDGTLVDSERVILNAWMESAQELGLPLDPAQYSRVIGLNEEESNALLIQLLGSEAAFLRVRSLAKSKLQAPAGSVVFPLKPGVLSLLAALSERKVPPLEKQPQVQPVQAAAAAEASWKPRAAARRLRAEMLRWRCCSS